MRVGTTAMTKAEGDLAKVMKSIKGTRFMSLSVVSLDVDVLEQALFTRYEQGVRAYETELEKLK